MGTIKPLKDYGTKGEPEGERMLSNDAMYLFASNAVGNFQRTNGRTMPIGEIESRADWFKNCLMFAAGHIKEFPKNG